jgi:hypothetical protein
LVFTASRFQCTGIYGNISPGHTLPVCRLSTSGGENKMRKVHKMILIAVAGLTMVGCVSVNNIPLATDATAAIKNRNVVTAKREKPDFSAMTAGKATFAMLGAVASISSGNEIVAKNNIEDPADYISEKLNTTLSAKYGSRVSSKSVSVKEDDVQAISKNNPDIDLLLDIRTINWSFIYFPTTWNKYRVIYSARLRLIDVKGKRVMAEGFCARVPDETPTSPTYDELLANNAERLKKELRNAADFCVAEFKSKVLQL